MVPAFLTTILFAISAVSASRTTRLLGGIEANFWRISLAALLLAAWAHGMGTGIRGEAFPYFLVSGCIGFGMGDLALYQALPRLGARLSILLVHCFAAPIAAATEWAWLGTTLTVPQVLCSLLILAGVGLALAPGKHLEITRKTLLTGIAFGLIAAAGQGLGAVLSRKAYHVAANAGQSVDAFTTAYQRILAGWGVAFATFLWSRVRSAQNNSEKAERIKDWTRAWKWIVVNAFAGPTLGVGCYQWALSTHPTGIVLPIVATTPIVVIPFARVMEGERPGIRSLLGGAIAVCGAVGLAGGFRLLGRIVSGH